MIFDYKIFSGEEILTEGRLVAANEAAASAKVYQKIPKKKINGLKVVLNQKTIFHLDNSDPMSKMFERPVAKKVDNRPPHPW